MTVVICDNEMLATAKRAVRTLEDLELICGRFRTQLRQLTETGIISEETSSSIASFQADLASLEEQIRNLSYSIKPEVLSHLGQIEKIDSFVY